MTDIASRFESLPDEQGTCIVWDKFAGAIASLGGSRLTGQTPERSKVACDILSKIYRNKLDRQSIHERNARAL